MQLVPSAAAISCCCLGQFRANFRQSPCSGVLFVRLNCYGPAGGYTATMRRLSVKQKSLEQSLSSLASRPQNGMTWWCNATADSVLGLQLSQKLLSRCATLASFFSQVCLSVLLWSQHACTQSKSLMFLSLFMPPFSIFRKCSLSASWWFCVYLHKLGVQQAIYVPHAVCNMQMTVSCLA